MYTIRTLKITIGRTTTSAKGEAYFPEQNFETLEEALKDYEAKKLLMTGFFRIVMLEEGKVIKNYQNY